LIDLLWLVLIVIVLSPILRWVGRSLFAPPIVPLSADPGPLVDSEPTTLGAGATLARMSTLTVLGVGLVLFPWVAGSVVLSLAELLAELSGGSSPVYGTGLFLGVYALLACGGLVLAFRVRARARARRDEPLRVEVYRDRVRLPVASLGGLLAAQISVPLASLRLIHENARGDLVLSAAGETFVVSRRSLADPEALPRLHDAIVEQLRGLPGGDAQLVRSEESIAAARRFLRRPAHSTRLVLVVCAAVFALEYLVGMDEVALFRLGANARALSWHGEWFRLFTASFLHVGLLHIVLNLLFISIFGSLVERIVGPARFAVVYLASSAIGAAVASGFDPLSAGASTGAFGLIGALGVLQYRFGDRLPIGFRLEAPNWVILIGLNAALPFLYPNISWSGHLGGLIGGALVCALAATGPEALEGGAAPRGVRAAAGLLVAVQLGAFAAAGSYALGPRDFQLAFVDALDRDPDTDVTTLNNVAWSIAIDPQATDARLAAAVRLARRAAESGIPELKDTLAQALHRVGDHDGAVRVEAEVVLHASTPVFATQLRRFLSARLEARGEPLVEPGGLGLQAVLKPSEPPVVGLSLPSPVAERRVAYWIGRPGGLLEVCVAAGDEASREAPVEGDVPPRGTTFEIAYLGGPAACPDGRARFFTAADPETSRLP
jgi:rhomboid protease GluP